jgi:hypothetical protein
LNATRQTTGRAALLLTGAGLATAFLWGPARVGLAQPVPLTRPTGARLAPPQPLESSDTIAVRAAPFDFTRSSDQPRDPTKPQITNSIPGDWAKTFPSDPPKPTAPGSAPADGGQGWFTDTTRAVKSALGLKPPEPQPQPRVGQVQAAPPPQPAVRPTGRSPSGAPVYSGVPAYRWYGWGSVTPGANPYAPGGESPQGSASWYAQTGATPGAFPVPVANPFRPPPGAGPPAYVVTQASPPPQAMAALNPSARFTLPAPPQLQTIAQTPPPVAYTPPPAAVLPLAPSPPPWSGGPVIMPGPPEPRWQPAAVPLSIRPVEPEAQPVVRGQQPSDDPDASIAAKIRAACDGLVSGVNVECEGQGRLVVSFAATTQTLAEIAARAVSAIPELRPVAVEFKATLTGR